MNFLNSILQNDETFDLFLENLQVASEDGKLRIVSPQFKILEMDLPANNVFKLIDLNDTTIFLSGENQSFRLNTNGHILESVEGEVVGGSQTSQIILRKDRVILRNKNIDKDTGIVLFGKIPTATWTDGNEVYVAFNNGQIAYSDAEEEPRYSYVGISEISQIKKVSGIIMGYGNGQTVVGTRDVFTKLDQGFRLPVDEASSRVFIEGREEVLPFLNE